MITLALVGVLMVLTSCGPVYDEVEPAKTSPNITYFKDQNTGLCFAALNSTSYGFYQVTSIACVPCDSLEKTIWRRQ